MVLEVANFCAAMDTLIDQDEEPCTLASIQRLAAVDHSTQKFSHTNKTTAENSFNTLTALERLTACHLLAHYCSIPLSVRCNLN